MLSLPERHWLLCAIVVVFFLCVCVCVKNRSYHSLTVKHKTAPHFLIFFKQQTTY